MHEGQMPPFIKTQQQLLMTTQQKCQGILLTPPSQLEDFRPVVPKIFACLCDCSLDHALLAIYSTTIYKSKLSSGTGGLFICFDVLCEQYANNHFHPFLH